MRFKICSVGWNCAQFIPWTLESVASQALDNWDMAIVYDPSDDNGGEIIREWCAQDPEHRFCQINEERRYAPNNQWDAVYELLKPEGDDVIIFLDLDGDKLAHPDVLKVLTDAYTQGALVTYGQYRPVPPTERHSVGMASEWPKEVVENNSYRDYTRKYGPCFNHLRTVSWQVFKEIPQSAFRWKNGEWYKGATDYVVMMPALELAGGRHKFIQEVILDYNHANPHADNTNNYNEGRQGHDATADVLQRPRMRPLKNVVPIPEQLKSVPVYGRDAPGSKELYLSADQRREILRAYGKYYGLNVFVETGTNDGGTPDALKNQFSQIYTIELSRKLWKAARNRFAGYPHITCLLGDSGVVLREVLAKIKEPALFWLDGHYSGGDTAHGDLDTPVVQELELILSDGRPHVILVDDARIFDGGEEHDMYPHYGDYPTQDWVRNVALENGFDCLLKDDIFRITPR